MNIPPTQTGRASEPPIHLRPVSGRAEWDAALEKLPKAHALQTWDWGQFKRDWGWQPVRLLFERDQEPVAAVQMLQRRLGRTPFAVAYVPKGPALDYTDLSLLEQVLGRLEMEARRRHCLFVKIDPDVWLGSGERATPGEESHPVVSTLHSRGWSASAEQIQFKNTVVVDLSAGEDILLADMKSKTRYNVRLAERRGVEVTQAGADDLPAFFRLYQETSERDRFLIRPFAYYRDVWSRFLATGRARLLLARVVQEPVAGLMLFLFAGTAWYMYGASSAEHRSVMPNYLLQWQAIRLAKELGCSRYDMWGAPNHFQESDPMWGVYRFKTGFGGQTKRGLGAYDFAPSAVAYFAYTVLMPRLVAIMRRRHRPDIGS